MLMVSLMHVVARPTRFSTCPLCRAEVTRATAVDCLVCGASCHPDCVLEIGSCHEPELQGLVLVDTERDPAQLAALNLGLASSPGEPPLTQGQRAARWVWAICLALATLGAGQRSPAFALTTGLMGLLGPSGFWQIWRGLSTGRIKTTLSNSKAHHCRQDEPCAFFFHATAWALIGLGCTTIALLPFVL